MIAPVHRIVLLLLIPLLAGCERQSAPANEIAAEDLAVPVKGVDRRHAGQAMPAALIRNSDGEESSLAELSGEPALINLWATWCAPCVKELPTLRALSERDGAPRVVAVSQDFGDRAPVDAFVEKQGLQTLEVWHDPDMALSGALGTQVLPTTILYDARGREVWRYVGDLDWTGAEAARLLGEAASAGAG